MLFIFILFFLFFRYLKFCPHVLVMWENGLIRKRRISWRSKTSQADKQTITIHLAPNSSRSKRNQTMKLGQLIEDNKRNTFFQKSCIKGGRETSSRSLFVFSTSFTWGKNKWSAPYIIYKYIYIYIYICTF